ncbi:MAG: sel1 repeat family protein [Verrucomicrobia bacterium]|nr:sel1 repeat family protein [Verrucomicrobiota bacterium]
MKRRIVDVRPSAGRAFIDNLWRRPRRQAERCVREAQARLEPEGRETGAGDCLQPVRRPMLLLLLGNSLGLLLLGFGLSNSRPSATHRPGEAKPWRTEAKRYLEANDYVKAEQLLKKVADAGDTDAMDHLGELYLYGPALYRDNAQARERFLKAAEAGNVSAMNHMGQLYLYGWGVTQDSVRARQWYQKAAEGGSSEAMYTLGWLYEHGWGGGRDVTRARRWYQNAAATGNAEAGQALSRMHSK